MGGKASGDAATINVNNALGFQCDGRYAPCPDNYLPPCPELEKAACKAPKVWDDTTCTCECLENPEVIRECSGQFDVFNVDTCKCELQCPKNAPTPDECALFGMEWRECTCHEVPQLAPQAPNDYCCWANPAQQDPVMWAGVCWSKRNEGDCMAIPNFRCLWNPYQCLPNPPVNSLNPLVPCKFNRERCLSFEDCCSEYCTASGYCR